MTGIPGATEQPGFWLIRLGVALLTAGAGFSAPARAEGLAAGYNDGTDPARPARAIALSHEQRRLADGDQQDSLFADVLLPLRGGRTVLELRMPFVSVGGRGVAIGDIGVGLSQVLPTGSHGAIIVGGQLEFDSARGAARGTGQTVATASLIVESILAGGTIVAPTVAHSLGVSGSGGGGDRINMTRFNLYVVPAVRSERLYLTFDPAITLDWGEGSAYADVALTTGYGVKRLMGADLQLFARPSLGMGKARSFDWAVELGVQLLNF